MIPLFLQQQQRNFVEIFQKLFFKFEKEWQKGSWHFLLKIWVFIKIELKALIGFRPENNIQKCYNEAENNSTDKLY